jgi:hypothetical protein
MNDFTKEELEELKFLLQEYTPLSGKGYDVFNKIQFMIDKYCEHKWGEDPNDGHGWMCILCGVKQ